MLENLLHRAQGITYIYLSYQTFGNHVASKWTWKHAIKWGIIEIELNMIVKSHLQEKRQNLYKEWSQWMIQCWNSFLLGFSSTISTILPQKSVDRELHFQNVIRPSEVPHTSLRLYFAMAWYAKWKILLLLHLIFPPHFHFFCKYWTWKKPLSIKRFITLVPFILCLDDNEQMPHHLTLSQQ